MGDSFDVVEGEKEPQAALKQATVHCTSGLAETSLVIATLIGAVVLICSEAGGAPWKATVIGMGGVMVMVADTDLVVSASEVAVTVTVPPVGMALGAL